MNLFPPDTYKARRDSLKKECARGIILLPGNGDSPMNYKGNSYPFRQDSSFLYYFGLDRTGIFALIDIDNNKEIIFGDDATVDEAVWTGKQSTIAELAVEVGVTQTMPLAKLAQVLGKVQKDALHFLPPYRGVVVLEMAQLLQTTPEKIKKGYSQQLVQAVIQQRLYKTAQEIEQLHQAATHTSAMHLAVMQAAKQGIKEHELVGLAYKSALSNGVTFSFPPIVTIHGQTLHNYCYTNTLAEDRLLLFDGGCESRGHYAGDMTRTFPVGSAFTKQQKAIYEIVYNAHGLAYKALKPNVSYKDIHLLACRAIVSGLRAVGLMKGDASAAVAAGAHTLFFPHGLGHLIGLDVHDMENLGEKNVGYGTNCKRSETFGLKSLRLSRVLEEGMALTVEPGIYFIPQLIDSFKSARKFEAFINYKEVEKYRDFGGIRIEDDFVLTANGAQLLGTPLARTMEEVEAVRRIALAI